MSYGVISASMLVTDGAATVWWIERGRVEGGRLCLRPRPLTHIMIPFGLYVYFSKGNDRNMAMICLP